MKKFATIYYWEKFLLTERSIKIVEKIWGLLKPGVRVAWYFADDAVWMRKGNGGKIPPPTQWPFSGIIVPMPDAEINRELEIEECCVIQLEYPVEKEYCEADWIPLAWLLSVKGFRGMHVIGHG